MLAITTSIHSLVAQTQQLANRWGFTFVRFCNDPFYLELTDTHLQLMQSGDKPPGPIAVDFFSAQPTYRRRFGGGKGQTLTRAVGLSKSSRLLILDATAGMGNDAFVFASLGAYVILLERSSISAALLEDGLIRGKQNEEIADIIQRMQLLYGDSLTMLPQFSTLELPEKFSQQPDVIYLDPMFPHRNITAQVKKEMLALQYLVGSDADSENLLKTSLNLARQRVVVKRPIKADYLAGQKPSYSMSMKKHRFDIYPV